MLSGMAVTSIWPRRTAAAKRAFSAAVALAEERFDHQHAFAGPAKTRLVRDSRPWRRQTPPPAGYSRVQGDGRGGQVREPQVGVAVMDQVDFLDRRRPLRPILARPRPLPPKQRIATMRRGKQRKLGGPSNLRLEGLLERQVKAAATRCLATDPYSRFQQ